MAAGAWFAAFWPITYNISKTVKPAGCAVFAVSWLGAYQFGLKPFLLNRLQGSLNSSAAGLAGKYKIKTDKDYLWKMKNRDDWKKAKIHI